MGQTLLRLVERNILRMTSAGGDGDVELLRNGNTIDFRAGLSAGPANRLRFAGQDPYWSLFPVQHDIDDHLETDHPPRLIDIHANRIPIDVGHLGPVVKHQRMIRLDGPIRTASDDDRLGASRKAHELMRIDRADQHPEIRLGETGVDPNRGAAARPSEVLHR